MTWLKRFLFLASGLLIGVSSSQAQARRPCEIVTSADAQGITGVPMLQVAADEDHCSYEQVGYTKEAPNNLMVWLAMYHHETANPNDVTERRDAFRLYVPPPMAVQNIPDLADAALWVWRGDLGGTVYAYRGGTVEVEAWIAGLPQERVLPAARMLAAKALGDTGRTGFAYAGQQAPPPQLHATNFAFFDRLPSEFQAEYVAVMIDATEKALRTAREGDAAQKVHQLMTTILPGDESPLGLVEYERNEARARVADLNDVQKNPRAERLDVADALFVTLEKNNIKLSTPVMDAVIDTLARFRSPTYAEFEALPSSEQRHYIALLVALAYPDYKMREAVNNRINGKQDELFDDPELRKRERQLIAAQFPAGVLDQPGFADLSNEIQAGYRKTPDDLGVFYSVVIHMLKMVDADILEKAKQMDDSTYHLPR